MSEKQKDREKSELAQREEEILAFWEEHNIFEKSVEMPAGDEPAGEFVFYDGPPFATGLPHYGHVLPGTIKDIIPRYQTMRGNRVRRRWGWDCHGLPVENIVEKELDLNSRKDIEEYGIAEFNERARESVLRYADEWRHLIKRTGRFIDMENDYKTMQPSYSESIWWAFHKLHDDGLVFEGYKSMHICPRCETTLSNFEVNQGYSDIKDFSVTVKFELVDKPNTFLLSWTTTPWTLPGNTAVAVNPDIDYVQATVTDGEYAGESYILSRERLEDAFAHSALTKGDGVEKGSWRDAINVEDVNIVDYVGEAYVPPFSYFTESDIEHKENAWKVYEADFVTDDEGTGLVHIAPAFGEEDMELAREHDLPVIHHVDMTGHFVDEVTDFAGKEVKPKNDHQRTDIEIIKYLAHNDLLVAKEKIEHSYPHCWRCDTPLLNYATSSWFVEVTKIKDRLVSENEEVGWIPPEIGSARFGNWLEGARDWAISRTRFWGAPLPVWRSADGEEITVIDSIETLHKHIKSSNNFLLMRHGEADHNVKGIMSSLPSNKHHLTETGEEETRMAIDQLKERDIDLIFVSPMIRTKETAELIRKELDLGPDQVIVDKRFTENRAGEFEGEPVSKWHEMTKDRNPFSETVEGGETYTDIRTRMMSAVFEIDGQYDDKNILIIGHGLPLRILQWASELLSENEIIARHKSEGDMATGSVLELDFWQYPHNERFELDLHRPYIDQISWENEDGQEMRRVEEVFDCWFESGSMPYASHHYPFRKDLFDPEEEKEFPADFIAEGLDQTRGWFYSLLVLSVALFDRSPYKNVIVNGIVLAEDGQKMSKSLGNYPPLSDIIDTYGADALRFYLTNSPAVRAESMRFSEDGVDEVVKKLIYRLKNVYSFYDMYTDESERVDDLARSESDHILDTWILSRLEEVNAAVSKHIEDYRLDKAARQLLDFVDDLSTWYLRRSRDRIRGDDSPDRMSAIRTTRFVLREFSKILAPFMPFVAEDMYQKTKGADGAESVHLAAWPEMKEIDRDLLAEMSRVRDIVSDALDLRAQAQIKVRQPLSTLRVPNQETRNKNQETLVQLIEDEVNVKEVIFDDKQEELELDIEVTDDLRREGMAREMIRNIQKLRKKAGLDPDDIISIVVDTSEVVEGVVGEYRDEIVDTAGLSDILFKGNDGAEVHLDGETAIIQIQEPNH